MAPSSSNPVDAAPNTLATPTKNIDTSIVLTTCSRAPMLRQALGTLIHQTWAETHAIEIIVVDDGSTDDTAAVLQEFQQLSSVPFLILQGPSNGVAAARNLGCTQARGTWLASFDDDQLASPSWLSALRSLADQTNAPCIGGALSLLLPEGTIIATVGPRVRGVLGEHLIATVPSRYSGQAHPATNNVLIRRDIFNALNGYDIHFTEGGEDKDFFARVAAAGHALWFQPAATAQHITPQQRLEVSNLRWTSIRVGAADIRVARHAHGITGPIKLALARIAISVGRDVPQLLYARLRRNTRALRDTQCSLWYIQGVLRALGPILGPHPERSTFLQSINFRNRNGERRPSR